MKAIKVCCIILLLSLFFYPVCAQNNDSLKLRQLFDEALVNGKSYKNLEYLCKNIGPRLSGSTGAAKAVDYTKKLMTDYGFDKVYLQDVMVPHWVRGAKEEASIIEGKTKINVAVAALGGSVATPKTGITAEIIEVKNFEELASLGEETIKGKIVFFNRPFDPKPIPTFISYSGAVNQRSLGPSEAAKYGAVAVIVRSMTHSIDNYPHTGGLRYDSTITKIPAAAISTQAAELLSRKLKLKKLPQIKFYLKQNCETLPDAASHNVIGEIKGTEFPDEIITVGGHLDSWDLAEGAHDDGTGVMQSIEVLRLFKSIGYKPKRTIRAVMFMNEENGLRGGLKYAELAKKNNEKHIAALESDAGGFTPRGFSIKASGIVLAKVNTMWKPLLSNYGLNEFSSGGSGSDIEPLAANFSDIVLIGFRPDSQRYFDIHHASNDVFENVNKRELELGGASMAALVYLIDQYGFK